MRLREAYVESLMEQTKIIPETTTEGDSSVNTSGQLRSNVTTSMSDLISRGLIFPGLKMLSVSYKGHTEYADLLEDGTIVYNGSHYTSPSGFSIDVKRQVGGNPSKSGLLKADNGWLSVRHKGIPLSEIRNKVLAMERASSVERKPKRQRVISHRVQAPESNNAHSIHMLITHDQPLHFASHSQVKSSLPGVLYIPDDNSNWITSHSTKDKETLDHPFPYSHTVSSLLETPIRSENRLDNFFSTETQMHVQLPERLNCSTSSQMHITPSSLSPESVEMARPLQYTDFLGLDDSFSISPFNYHILDFENELDENDSLFKILSEF